MALVNYESSDSEQEQPKSSAAPKIRQGASNKPTFEKFVDKSNPGKVRLNFVPDSSKTLQEDPSNRPVPPAKRAKTGDFGAFNSLLPAPKHTTGTVPGFKKGINLKTGAEPGFTREPMQETQRYDSDQQRSNVPKSYGPATGPAESRVEQSTVTPGIVSTASVEIPLKNKSTIFKPLSVVRKPQKKSGLAEGRGLEASKTQAKPTRPEMAPKISLFSGGDISESSSSPLTSTGTYQPLVYQRNDDDLEGSNLVSQLASDGNTYGASKFDTASAESQQSDSLDDIAADLNLSASARRQLLGRNQRDGKTSSIKITNFNTDQEYAANEALRQSGEIVQHNAVRSIAPGKHSLKQLVNVATTQKDALEEQFAAGRRNKSESGAKYGW